jgi:hypothetical protein
MIPKTVLGANVAVDYTAPTNPVLSIPFNDIKVAIDWGTAPTAETENLEPWIMAIIQKLRDFDSTATTSDHNIVVAAPFPGVQTRNSIANRNTFAYTVTAYSTTTASAKPDGDNFA